MSVAAALVENGYLELARQEARRGDFDCADALARACPEEAVELYRPFAAAGVWMAVHRLTGVLPAEEAIALVRPQAEAGERLFVVRLAELLAEQGRIDEAISVLRPGLDDWYLARALVELTAGRDRDDEVLNLLLHHESLRATVLERQGRPDEAVALLTSKLRGPDSYDVGHAQQIARILAWHDPPALLEFAAGDGREYATRILAESLEDQGRTDEAIEVLRGDPSLPELLVRHGRLDEAIELLHPLVEADPEQHFQLLCTLLIRQGRAGERPEVPGLDPFDVRMDWVEALVECGRTEEAIAALRDDPDADSGFVRARLATLLADEEAIAVLRPDEEAELLATLLIRQGRPGEALELLRRGDGKSARHTVDI
ncbi:hypothetical protein AFR_22450 [Actinoplanes friuliensis DSM 7358]|uniref:Tetratricopeptide repeat protein n=1 Tax=Actinoplanes friuliensis DSM 7358 TaxID=1246995 RepID=U5W452_9ACTN|nr:hypothetical protein AFR_22450 [Actinoplanes friuliensis DSM 7358]